MRIGVLGAGSMGSLFAGLLAASETETVLFGRESAHVAAVEDDGLRLVHPDGAAETVDVPVVTDPLAAPPCDYVLVCVKSYDTADALSTWRGALVDAAVATFQNGLGNAATLAEYVPEERVLAGTTSHGATLEGSGVVRHAGRGETRLGKYFALNDASVRTLATTLSLAGVETDVVDDVPRALWRKVLVNVGINAATALARVENGALAETESGERLVRRAVAEAARVARHEGIDVGDPVEETLTVAARTASNRSSMRQDVEAGRKTEVEALHGAVVSRAEDAGLPAPVNRTLADLVRLAEGD
ncbi:ketopantoate reductase family protein [Halarchaeum sp. P4]|uniref:ketopantoate reductase family protein n=1 Tax=Halarchaeum sp. P4 TaxID=3421639 RepID=UPI003EBF0C63